MAHRTSVERVRHPNVIVLADDAALCVSKPLVVGADQSSVRCKLANFTGPVGSVPNVAAAVGAETVTRMTIALPIDAVRTCQRQGRIPPKHRVRRPDKPCFIHESAITSVT